jgi:hypothetical protein
VRIDQSTAGDVVVATITHAENGTLIGMRA